MLDYNNGTKHLNAVLLRISIPLNWSNKKGHPFMPTFKPDFRLKLAQLPQQVPLLILTVKPSLTILSIKYIYVSFL